MRPELLYSVIIPNWCGGDMLRHGLRALVREARCELAADPRWTFEIVVCDDASPDGDGEALRRDCPSGDWPELRIIQRTENGGFGPTVNQACMEARGALLCLCNNDLAPQAGYFRALLAPLLQGLNPADLAAVAGEVQPFAGVCATTARTEDATGQANHAAMRGAWHGGRMILHWRERPMEGTEPGAPMEVDFLQAGAAALRAGTWRALGGLDDLFAPGYWEDYDLSQRLRASGGRILFAPTARAFHLGKASMKKKHGAGRVRDLTERNRILFERLHAPREQQGWLQARGLGAAITREWRHGGPFHVTKGLLLAWKRRGELARALESRGSHPPPPSLSLEGYFRSDPDEA